MDANPRVYLIDYLAAAPLPTDGAKRFEFAHDTANIDRGALSFARDIGAFRTHLVAVCRQELK